MNKRIPTYLSAKNFEKTRRRDRRPISRRRRLFLESLEDRRLLAGSGPVVSSILRDDVNPTALSSVGYRVTFDEVVEGVDSTDFVFQTTGSLNSPAILSVADVGSGNVYVVTVDTGTGEGSLRLDVQDDNSIVRASNTNKKLGGNQIGDGDFNTGQVYTIDRTAPTATNISLIGTPTATAPLIEYNVTFSETVTGVNAGDFQLITSGLTGSAINGVSGSGTTYVVQVATGSGEGTVQLALIDDDSIIDVATNPLGGVGTGTQQTGPTHAVDVVAPTVLSITAAQPNPTNSSLIDFTVTFSRPVMNVGLNDFALTTSASISGAMITNVAGTSDTFTVTVATGSGDGTIQLGIVNPPTITDLAGNVMLATSTTSPLVTIDKTEPGIASLVFLDPSVTNAAQVRYRVLFAEPVLGFGTEDISFQITGSVAGVQVDSITGSGDDYEVTVGTGTGEGTFGFVVNNTGGITDLAGNVRTTTAVVGPLTMDRTAPMALSVTPITVSPSNSPDVYFDVLFDEDVRNYSSNDFAIVAPGFTSPSVASVTFESTYVRRVHVNTGSGSGDVSINVLAGQGATDVAGNLLANALSNNPAVAVDRSAPSLLAITRDDPVVNNLASVSYSVTFSEPVINVDLADFTLVQSGGIGGASLTGVEGSAESYTITTSTGTGDGTLQLAAIAGAAISDLAGNSINTSFPNGEVYILDRTPPSTMTISGVSPASVTTTNSQVVQYQVDFAEPVTGITSAAFYPHTDQTGNLSNLSVTNVAGSGSTYVVTINVGAGDRGPLQLGIDNPNGLIKDLAGNPIAYIQGSGFNYLIDRVAPNVVSINRSSSSPTSNTTLVFDVLLSESVTGIDADDFLLDVTGTIGGSIASISGSGTTYTVSVTRTGDNGTLGLNLVDDNSVVDGAGNLLGGATLGDGNFIGQVYTITSATISGEVFSDEDGDGVRDGNENGLAGMIVFVDLNSDGVRDAGEPTTTTLADDPGTSGFNEAGTYTFTGLAAATFDVAIEVSGNYRQSAPLAVSTADGTLTLTDSLPFSHVSGPSLPTNIKISPDGNSAVAVWQYGEKVTSYTRNPLDGSLTLVSTVASAAGTLFGAQDAVFSPAGDFVYVPATNDDAINVFSLEGNGSLTFVETVNEASLGSNLLNNVSGITLTPDGSQLIATSQQSPYALTVFSVNPNTGALTLSQTLQNGDPGISSLYVPTSPVITPDGTLVIVPQINGFSTKFFDRDPATGVLSPGQSSVNVGYAQHAVITTDGQYIFVASSSDATIRTLQRDAVTGIVSQIASTPSGASGWRLAISPDNSALYLASTPDSVVSTFSIDPQTRSLTLQQSIVNLQDFMDLEGANGIAVSPDGKNVYVTAQNSNAIHTFQANQGVRLPVAQSVTTEVSTTVIAKPFAIAVASPEVVSLTTSTPANTTAATIDFNVLFSEAVTGVDVRDFSLYQSTLAGATISNVTGGPTTYTVTVNAPAGEGDIRLQLNDDDSILDLDATPIGGVGTGAVVARSNVIHKDSIFPTVTSILPPPYVAATATSVDFYVAFSEAVTGVDMTDFATVDSGATTSSVTAVTGEGAAYRVTVSTASGNGEVRLDLIDDDSIVDVAGNSIATGLQGATFTVATPRVSGSIWIDADGDGVRQASEVGRENLVVYADLNNNGARDAGEPFTTTLPDNPSTANMNEAGQYLLADLAANAQYTIAIDIDPDWEQTSPLVYPNDDSTLTLAQAITAGVTPDRGLDNVDTITVSADGRHVYSLSLNYHQLTVWDRDIANHSLTKSQEIRTGIGGVPAMYTPKGFELTPDGRFGYLISENNDSVLAFARNSITGQLSFLANYQNGVDGVADLDKPRDIKISADGTRLFVAAYDSNALTTFTIDPQTGLLTPSQVFREGVAGVTAMTRPSGIMVTPDGTQVAVTALLDSTVNVFDIAPGNGSLSLHNSLYTGTSVYEVSVSPDGRYVYMPDRSNANIGIYSRNVISGDWTFVTSTASGANEIYSLGISPDGTSLYLADAAGDQVVVFDRDNATGLLTTVQTLTDTAPHDLLGGAVTVVVTPDGRDVLVGSRDDDSLSIFARLSGISLPTTHTVTTTYVRTSGIDFGLRDEDVPTPGVIATTATSPTTATTIDFTVAFSEAVSGVDLSDFELAPTSLVGASISGVSGGPTDYTITVNTGSGTGDVQLTLLDNDSIVDGSGNPIGGVGDNASVSSSVITADLVSPTWTSTTQLDWTVNSLDEVRFRIEFSESVTGVGSEDFVLNTGISDASIASIVGGGTVYTITVNTGSESGQLGLALAPSPTIFDATGNALSQVKSVTGYTIDRTPPIVTSIEPMDTLTTGESWFRFEIRFDERVKFLDISDFEVVTTGTASATVESVLGTNNRFEVMLRRTAFDGTVTLKVADDATIQDFYENDLVGGFISSQSYVLPADVTYSGVIWTDSDGNGVFDANESPAAGAVVFHDSNRDGVLGATEVSSVTLADGSYSFVSHWQANAVITELLSASDVQTYPASATPSLVRLTNDDDSGNQHYLSAYPSISGDGSVVAFESTSTSLVAGDTTTKDIFVHDAATDTISKISIGFDGSLADGVSDLPVISDNGQFVVFRSAATNLVANDTNGIIDIFVFDRVAGTTERVNVGTNGSQANSDGYRDYDISADGRFVVFESRAVTIDPSDTTSDADIYVRDRLLGTTTLISTGTYQNSPLSFISGSGTSPSISDDGNIVAFESYVPAVYGGSIGSDIWIVNRSAGTIKQAHNFYLTGEPYGDSFDPRVSGDGSSIVFFSETSVSGIAHPDDMIFVYDVASEKLEMIARSTGGDFVDVELRRPTISHDGRYVAYISKSDKLTAGDFIPHVEGFVYDRLTGLTQPVTRRDDGSEGSEQVDWLSLSSDGSTVAFGTQSALVLDDVNEQGDIYRRSVGIYQPSRSHVVTPVGTTVTNLDFGIVTLQSGTIIGELFEDTNRDGIRQAGEVPIVGRTVYIDVNNNSINDAGEPVVSTDASGKYELDGVAAGTYTIRQDLPPDWSPTTGDGDGSTTVSIGFSQSVSVDFEDLAHSSTTPAAIPTYTSNGFTFGGNDPFFTSKWRVAGNPVSPESTSIYPGFTRTSFVSRRDGASFDLLSLDAKSQSGASLAVELIGKRAGLPDVVQTVNVTGAMQTFALTGFTDVESVTWSQLIAVDNFDFTVAQFNSAAIPLGSQITPAELSGTVWVDANSDGIVDAAESRLEGWVVFQDNNSDGVRDTDEPFAVSDTAGNYTIDAIEPGPSTIVIETVVGYEAGVPGWSASIDAVPGGSLLQSFSFAPLPSTINGYAWLDTNQNGSEDTGEIRVAGVTVFLDTNGNASFDPGEPSTTSQAGDLGFYEFTDLAANTYSVRVLSSEFSQLWPTDAHVVSVGLGETASRDFGVIDPLPNVFSNQVIGTPTDSASQLSYSVKFSKPVTGVDFTDFTVVTTGTLVATVSHVAGDSADYVVEVSVTSGTGTVLLRIVDNDSIIDATGDPLGGVGDSGDFDSAATSINLDDPVVSSISVAGPLVTSLSSVAFDLEFSKTVTGVDLSDFTLNATGITDAAITSVDGSGANYTVTVSTGTSDGTLSLALVDNDSIVDGNLQPLGGVGVGNGDALSNVVQIFRTGSIAGRIYYDANQNGQLGTGEYGVSGLTVYLDLNNNNVFDSATEPSTVTVTDDPLTTGANEAGNYEFASLASGIYHVRGTSTDWPLSKIVTVSSGNVANGDQGVYNAPPTLVSLTTTATSYWTDPTITYTVTFSEPVYGLQATDFTIFNSLSNNAGNQIVHYAAPSISGGPTLYTVTLTATNNGQGETQLSLNDYDRITDSLGIPLGGVGTQLNVGISPDLSVDLDTPLVESIVATNSPIIGSYDATFVVRFSEVVSGVDVLDFDVLQNGVTGASVSTVTGRTDGRTFDVVVASGTLDGTLQLQVIDNDSIIDAASKPLGGAGLNNGDFLTGSIVDVERNASRDIVGNAFIDENGNGVWEPGIRGTGEPTAAGVRVYLDTNDNDQRDSFETTVLTDVNGFYRFNALPLGTYEVRVDGNTNWVANAGSNQSVVLDFVTAEGLANVSVTANEATISGRVFDDVNQDGLFDSSDSGLSGWTVYIDSNLNQQFDAFETNKLTMSDDPLTPEDEEGMYRFSPLELTFHNVRIVPQSNFLPTSPVLISKTLSTPTALEIANFGVTANLTSISGTVFDDINGNGTQEVGDNPSSGWTVFLDSDNDGVLDIGETSQTTDATGAYSFNELSLGSYRVRIVAQAGNVITSANVAFVSIATSTDAVVVDFATHQNLTTLAGNFFNDLNGNGVSDGGEGPVVGATVYLDLNDNARLDIGEPTTTTNSQGDYSFSDVQPGDVVVRVQTPPGYELTKPSQPVDRLFVWHGGNTLREIDPIDGSILGDYWQSTYPTTSITADGLAFDGKSLWAMDRQQYKIFQVDPDAVTIEREIDVSSLNPITHGIDWNGMSVVGATLHVTGTDGEYAKIDIVSGNVISTGSVFSTNIGSAFLSGVNALYGSGVSADGQSLVVSTDNDTLLTIDPATMTITASQTATTSSFLSGVDSVGGLTYVSQTDSSSLLVFDAAGVQTGSLFVGCRPYSVAAGTYLDHAVRVNVTLDQQVTDIDFGAASFTGIVTGIEFQDENGNGVLDVGEQPVAGATIFVDLNNDGSQDSNEPFAISAADGTYTIEGVAPGTFNVRAVSPTNYRPSDFVVAEDRLFGLRNFSGMLRIDELDRSDGSIVDSIYTSVPYESAYLSMAFDGVRFIVIDTFVDMLYQVDVSGDVIVSRHLGEPSINQTNGQTEYADVTDYGPVVIGGTIYTVRAAFGLALYQYDPIADEFTYERQISYDYGLSDLPSGYFPSQPAASYGSGITADGTQILLATSDDRYLRIDPATGFATFNPEPSNSGSTDYAIDSVGGETFIAFSGHIQVVDNAGNLLRDLTGVQTYLGLAGGTSRDNATSVNVVLGQTVTSDHGHVSTLSTISGSITSDSNGNGSIDSGEPAVVGATVYLDLNRNAAFDAGEPTTTTDASGAYTFTGVEPGEYWVRQVRPADTFAHALTADQTRLFQAIRGTHNIVVIQELDPNTGEVLNQFDSPQPTNAGIGLAVKGDRLYYSRGGGIDILDANSGTILGTIPISNGIKDGLAILGDRAYVQDYNDNTIQVIDLVTRRVVGNLDIGLANGGAPGSFDLAFSLAEAPDGIHLAVVPYSGGDVSIVDPSSGVIVGTFPNAYAGYGSASAGGEYFERGSSSGIIQSSINVSDHLALWRRAIPLSYEGYVFGLGATSVPATAHQITVYADESITGIDFGNLSTTATISGVQFVDANDNQTFDAGELPLQGVTVYVDSNANGIVDAGEPSTISGVDGTYTLIGVPRGSQLIRTSKPGFESTSVFASDDRLFGTTRITDASSPTQYVLRVIEIDPQTGLPLAYIDTSIPVLSPYASAFDGKRFIIVDNTLDKIMQVSLDGALIAEAPLPELGGGFAYAQGPAVIDGTVYVVMTGAGAPLRLERYDLETNQFYGATQISVDVSQDPFLVPMPQLSEAVAESPDGKSILIFSYVDSRMFVVDPTTARITSVIDLPDSAGSDYAAATTGGELFVRGVAASGQLNVYDQQYNAVRTAPNLSTSGLGGGTTIERGQIIDVSSATLVLDTGQQPTYTDVSGSVSFDANVNGQVDAGEESVGATVFLDANRNGTLDAGEQTTTTLSDGSYLFSQLPPGDYSVVVDHPTTDRVVTSATETALFALEVNGGVSTIRKHDAITGQVLREFQAPGASTDNAGMAVDAFALYYSSNDGVWMLDRDTGAVKSFIDLPNSQYDGLAALGGRIYLLNSANESILTIDPQSGDLLSTLSINAINNSSYNLSGNLGESTDGQNLIIRLPSGGGLVIDPETGVIDHWYAYNYGAYAIAGAGGELYRSNGGTSIRVENEQEQQIRSITVGYEPRALAAALVPASSYDIRAAYNVQFAGQDFQLAPADQFPPVTISGMVWSDDDRDGVRDSGEPGIAGVTVYLDLNHNGILDTGDVSQVTLPDDSGTTEIDESGSYLFSDLAPGNYDVRQVLLPSSIATSPINPAISYDQRYDTNFTFVGFQHHPVDDLRLSATGRYLVYSTTRQVLPSDTNTTRDIYLLDRQTNLQELISISTSGAIGNGNDFEPDVSEDGRFVIFRSASTNLDPADTSSINDIYVRDRWLGTTMLVSKSLTGSDAGGHSADALITPDGQHVFFYSFGTNLVAGDTNNVRDSFVANLSTGVIDRVSLSSTGAQFTDDSSYGGDITPDGRYVIFESKSAQVLPGDSNSGGSDIFWKDRVTGEVKLASASAQGAAGNNQSQKRSMSDDGRWVVFDSLASNLTSDPHPGSGEAYFVYIKDMLTGGIQRINSNVTGAYPGNSQRPEISGDGRFVVFESDGMLVAGDTNQRVDVYLYDRIRDQLVLVSQGTDGLTGNGSSNNAVISADSSTIAFTTDSSNILAPNSVGGIVTVNIDKLLAANQVNLTGGGQSTDNDFGQVIVSSSITGTLWDDQNADGIIDSSEQRLVGRTVFLDTNNNGELDVDEPYQVTNDDNPATPTVNEAGNYEFTGLAAGNYVVRQILPSGWTQTSPLETQGVQLLADTGYIHNVNTAAQPIFDSAASDDGRFVAFTTDKSMLPIDTNQTTDIYVIDRTTGVMELVSKSTTGLIANGASRNVSISGDGRYVVYRTTASNLSTIDTNGDWDIYRRDRQSGTTTLISLKPESIVAGEIVGNGFSYNPQISRDGSVVTFWSSANNLVSGDTNGRFDIFLRDLQSGAIERINVTSSEVQAFNGESHESLPSFDGQLVGFWSQATNLVPGDTNGFNDVFIRDRQAGTTERVSVSATGEQGNGNSDHFSMSDDGRYFVFQSNATNLTSDVGLTGNKQIYLKDRQTGTVTLVSKGDSALPSSSALYPSISADGRWITYQSWTSNIVPGDTNGKSDVFLYDTLTGINKIISQDLHGGASNGHSDWPRMSRDGSTILFSSESSDLVDQPPTAGGLYIYRTQNDDPFAMNVSLGLDQTLENRNFGSQVMVDRGDAPASYGEARHVLDANVRLGNLVSFDLVASQLDPDDDGVVATSRMSAGFNAQFDVTTSTAGTLAAWIDFDGDGVFDPEERSEFPIGVADTVTTTSIQIPISETATLGATYARFRFSTDAASVQSPTGQSPSGEVEDYAFTIESPIAPADITLSNSSINENTDTSAADLLFAQLSAIDEDPGDIHSYSLVTGDGDSDNARFAIFGDQLYLKQGEILDFESQPNYNVRVLVTDSAGLTFEKTINLAVNNLVEVTKEDITVGDGTAQRSRVESISIQFDVEVVIGDGAFTVIRREDGSEVGFTVVPTLDTNGHTVATLVFTGANTTFGSLVKGNYELSIDGSRISSLKGEGFDSNGDGVIGDSLAFGNEISDNFYRFYGDYDGDRDVDYTDFAYFRLTLLKSIGDGGFNRNFDYESDGDVDYSDYAYFRLNLLRTLGY